MALKAVIFDLDGTLLDSLEDLAVNANTILKQFGFPEYPLKSYRQFVGEGARILINRATGLSDDEKIDEITQAYKTLYSENINKYSRLYDGIEALLDTLQARRIPMAVLSNKPDLLTKRCYDLFYTPWNFTAVLGQRESVPMKPDPTGALEIASDLGLPPGEIAFVGDTKTDMQTAKNAGMFAIGVTWGFREEAELREHGADVIVHHPMEIPRFFE